MSTGPNPMDPRRRRRPPTEEEWERVRDADFADSPRGGAAVWVLLGMLVLILALLAWVVVR